MIAVCQARRKAAWRLRVISGDTFTVSRNIQMLRFGLNYRFDWTLANNPVTARYSDKIREGGTPQQESGAGLVT
jgi:hypothetical protein